MNDAQKKVTALQIEQSEVRQKLNELLTKSERDETESAELETLTTRAQALEPELRAALVLSDAEEPTGDVSGTVIDAETREKLELRAKCSVTNFFAARMQGRLPSGAEAEYSAAENTDGKIPLSLFDEPVEQRADASTGSPATVGINLQPIRPQIFSQSIAPMLNIEMPRVASGTYAEATISAGLSAGAVAKDEAFEATAAGFAVSTATPKRITGRLGVRIEDVSAIGQVNFESALRQNLMLVMGDELDNQIINGAGVDDDLNGIFQQLTDVADAAALIDFDGFVEKVADGVEGLWANSVKDIGILCGPATYKLSAKTFQTAANYKGEMSAASYLMKETGGWRTNKRMPATAAMLQKGLLFRSGRKGIKTAVCPHWGSLEIDDIYSGSAAGIRFITFHILVGDVILVQPDAYAEVSYKVAA